MNTLPLANAGFIFKILAIKTNKQKQNHHLKLVFSVFHYAGQPMLFGILLTKYFTGSCKRRVHTQSATFLPNSEQMLISHLKIYTEAKYTKFTKTTHCYTRHAAQVICTKLSLALRTAEAIRLMVIFVYVASL